MMIARRQKADGAWRSVASEAIARRLLDDPRFEAARTVCLYVAAGAEVETARLIAETLRRKGEFVAPRLGEDLSMTLHAARAYPEGFALHALGFMAPEASAPLVDPASVDFIIAPGVAFDRSGGRLGRGKGLYDRLLERAPAAIKVGLAFSFQVVEDVPADERDVSMDAVITEAETIEAT